ncbi:YveK family protein [Inediibacterium massiliense]|uniref:YveK family protein n=1 Tax=Inediibacterium massiliense TaxID=1658111 RepID=UPI0006B4C8A4|nr:GNVR domain-containing protein [Inediibacterium massiliense]
MEQQNTNQYEEISLREIIEILLKGKKIIFSITMIMVLLSGMISFFVLDPQYESATTMSITNVNPVTTFNTSNTNVVLSDGEKTEISEALKYANKDVERDISFMFDSLFKYPTTTVEGVIAQMKSPYILKKVIEQLKLDEEIYTVQGLQGQIEATAIEKTNMIEIKVKNNDSKVAADIANAVGKEIVKDISQQNQEYTKKMKDYLGQIIQVEEKKLDEMNKQIEVLDENDLKQNAMKKRLNAKLEVINNTYSALVQKNEQIDLIDKADLGESSVVISSPALEAKHPVEPRKALNVAIALVLGLMIGVFVAFFKAYWESTKVDAK